MRVAIGSGVLLGIVALVCFAAGTVATMVIVSVVLLLAAAEAYAAFGGPTYHPATLLGLVAVLSLLIETYNKGVAALPLVLVLLVAGSFIWYLARVNRPRNRSRASPRPSSSSSGSVPSGRSPRSCSTPPCSQTATESPSSWPRSS